MHTVLIILYWSVGSIVVTVGFSLLVRLAARSWFDEKERHLLKMLKEDSAPEEPPSKSRGAVKRVM